METDKKNCISQITGSVNMINENIKLENKTVFVTGAAGFIGANLVAELLNTVGSVNVVGIDNMNDYYDVSIKKYRLADVYPWQYCR